MHAEPHFSVYRLEEVLVSIHKALRYYVRVIAIIFRNLSRKIFCFHFKPIRDSTSIEPSIAIDSLRFKAIVLHSAFLRNSTLAHFFLGLFRAQFCLGLQASFPLIMRKSVIPPFHMAFRLLLLGMFPSPASLCRAFKEAIFHNVLLCLGYMPFFICKILPCLPHTMGLLLYDINVYWLCW